ncbi:MAG: anti-sigma factor [Reichenbachiella sp.]
MKRILLSLMALSLVFVSCDDEDDTSFGTLSLSISGLGNLGDDYVYEGWVVVDGSPVTTGVFTVDADGVMSQTSFEMDEEMLDAATTFVLSIEPAIDSDPSPSATKILGGDFSGSSASVSIMHGAAFGTGFGGVSGSYILKTPTTDTDEDDLSGVWFLDPADGSAALVDLPDLTDQAGWVYEGWAVIGGVPVSTGRFNMAKGADQSAAFSGPNAGPEFPGEDFITNAPGALTFPTDLTDGGVIVISIEPEPDNSANPFELKPLKSEVPSDLAAGTLQSMENIAASTYPSGSVSR